MACSIRFVPYACAVRAVKTLRLACFLLEEMVGDFALDGQLVLVGGNLLLLLNNHAFDSAP